MSENAIVGKNLFYYGHPHITFYKETPNLSSFMGKVNVMVNETNVRKDFRIRYQLQHQKNVPKVENDIEAVLSNFPIKFEPKVTITNTKRRSNCIEMVMKSS